MCSGRQTRLSVTLRGCDSCRALLISPYFSSFSPLPHFTSVVLLRAPHRGTISKAASSLNMLRPEIKKASTSSMSWMGLRSTSGTQKWLKRRGFDELESEGWTVHKHWEQLQAAIILIFFFFKVKYARAVDLCLSSSVFSLRCWGNVSYTWFVFWMSCWYGLTGAKWSDSQICWVYFRILFGFGNLRAI